MRAIDHLPVEAHHARPGRRSERGDDAARVVFLGIRWGEGGVDRAYLVRVDRKLAREAVSAGALQLDRKSVV